MMGRIPSTVGLDVFCIGPYGKRLAFLSSCMAKHVEITKTIERPVVVPFILRQLPFLVMRVAVLVDLAGGRRKLNEEAHEKILASQWIGKYH